MVMSTCTLPLPPAPACRATHAAPPDTVPAPLPRPPAELGRVASHYYIRHSSIVTFNEHLKPHLGEADVLAMIAASSGGCSGGSQFSFS